MPDAMDAIQERVLLDTEAAVAARTAPKEGRTQCAHIGCGEPIAPERTALGARFCLDCQRAAESSAAHFRTWGRR